MYFQGHVERIRMDMCDLGKTEVILTLLPLHLYHLLITMNKWPEIALLSMVVMEKWRQRMQLHTTCFYDIWKFFEEIVGIP